MSEGQMSRRAEDLERLLEATRLLAQESDLDALMPTIVAEATKSLDCDRATVYLYEEDTRELATKFVTEMEVEEIRISIDQGVAGRAARERVLQHVENADQDKDHAKKVARDVGYHVRNMLATPLVAMPDHTLVGVLQVFNKLSGEAFDRRDENMLEAFASHAAIALNRARLLDEYRAKQQIEASLAVAREIQTSLFPKEMPELAGYELAGRSLACDATGGDYYDVLELGDGHVGLVLGDVSGHGVGPSLLMATARAIVHALVSAERAPNDLITRLNRAISDDLSTGRFITFFYGILDTNDHTLAYSNAGQGPLWRYHATANAFIEVPATDLPLGILEDVDYQSGRPVALEPGDLLILPSDGIIEAANAGQEQFQVDRVQQIVREHRDRPCAEMIDAIFDAVRGWAGADNQQDDLTLLVARRT